MSAQTKTGRGNGETQWDSVPGVSDDLHEDIEHHRAEIDRTLSALEARLSPSDLLDEVLRNLNGGPGQFVNNLGTTVRDNPIPITLIGVGLGWLMLGQGDGTGQLRQKIGQMGSREDTYDRGTMKPEGFEDSSVDDMGLTDLYAFCLRREYPFDEDEVECILFEDLGPEAATEYRGGAFGPQAMGTTTGGAGLALNAGAVRDDAKARIDRTRLRMAAGADDVRSRASEARRKAMKRATRTRNAVSEDAQRTAEHASNVIERYPLSVLALGVAAGAALGAGMPSTKAEDRLMGEDSDAVKKQVGDAAGEKVDEARRAAKAATAAARDEAHEQRPDQEGLADKGSADQQRAREAAMHESGRLA